MSSLAWSPVAAEASGSDFSSLEPPPRIDPGESRVVPMAPPVYAGHEVRTPLPMVVSLAARTGEPTVVEGLPVTLTVLPAKTAADLTADGTVAAAEPPAESATADTAVTEPAAVEPIEETPVETSVDAVVDAKPVESTVPPVDVATAVRVESLDASVVAALGGEVLAFGVESGDGVSMQVTIDYSAFRYALGAQWSSRLQLVQWSCLPAMAKVAAKDCGNPVPVVGVFNDLKAGVLTATVTVSGSKVLAGGGQALPMLVAGGGSTLGLASAAGSFEATSLSNSGAWQVGGNNGSFSYSMPLATPPAFNGLGPSVSLSYDSSGVDGITSSVNAQASEVGLGWSVNAGQGFIERRYLPCMDSRIGGGTTDSCWYTQNATISLNGHASELIPIDGTTGSPSTFAKWRLKDDPDWLVERLNSTSGDWWTSEHWKVTTPEGMVYWFGRNDEFQNSRLVRPLRGISSSNDPCWYRASKLCTDMPYRWMLDRVVDPYGNTMIYKYFKEQNKARTVGSKYTPVVYDSAAYLTEILYGQTPATTAVGGGAATAAISFRGRVEFSYVRRCVQALSSAKDADCPAVTNANGASYPDTPTDLFCEVTATECSKDVSFFQIRRLSFVTTSTHPSDTVAWAPVAQWRTDVSFPDSGDGGNEKLWLYQVMRVNPDATVIPPVPPVALLAGTVFGGVALQNRRDGNPAAGVPYMNQYRISSVFDDLGQQITVSYESPTCASPYDWSTNTTNCFPMYASFTGGGAGWGVYRRWVVDKVVVHDMVAGGAGTGAAPDITTDYTYAGAAWHHDGTDWWQDTPGVDDVSWGQWRGYRTVTTTVGIGTGVNDKTVSKQVFYQGMHGDKAASGTKTVAMPRGFAMTAGYEAFTTAIVDDDWLAGSVFESYQMDGTTGSFLSASRSYANWTQTSTDATVTRTGFTVKQTRKWRTTLTHTVLRDGGSGSTSFKFGRVDTSVDALGRTTTVQDAGFLGVTGDETCQATRYITAATVPSPTSPGWMNLVAGTVSFATPGTLPAQNPYNETTAGACTGRPVAESKVFYNNNPYASGSNALDSRLQTIGAGFRPFVTVSLTRTKNWDLVADALDRWLVTRATFDAAGRTVETFDANGTRSAVFSFNATYGYPNKATYPLTSVGFTQSTLRPADGQPASTTDQNGNVTVYCYDALSRLSKAFQPTLDGSVPDCASTVEPTVTFAYSMGAFTLNAGGFRTSKEPAIVVTSTLLSVSPLVRKQTTAFIDGFGRTRETQQWSPTTGKSIVTATLFDDRGNAKTTIEPFTVTDTPGDRVSPTIAQSGGFVTYPALPSTPVLRTNTATFDTAGRTLTATRSYGPTPLVSTATEYLGTRTVTKPQLGSWQATTLDALGRTVQVETYNGTTAPAAAGLANAGAITTYTYAYDQTANSSGPSGYSNAGRLTTTVTDDATNATTVTTDLAGRTITSLDPNAGTSKFTYDYNGNITSTVDALLQTVTTAYDVLNRPTARSSASVLLAEWSYDTAAGGKGMAASETSWQDGLAYTTSVVGYTRRSQPTETRVTIPGTFDVDLLAGVWKFKSTFNEAGQPVSVYKPLAPVDALSPAADPVWDITTTHYDGFGQADELWEGVSATPLGRYVKSTVFDDLGRVTSRTLTRAADNLVPALRRAYVYDAATGALAEFKAGWKVGAGAVSTWFQHDEYTRDAIGRVTSIDDLGVEPVLTPLGEPEPSAVKECFLYDQWSRLVRAHSAAPATGCATTTTAATVATGSRDAYDTLWAFDDINRMSSTTDMLSGAATSTYGYTSGHPHAITSVTGATTGVYAYNAKGAMTTRAGATLSFDAQQRLTSYGTSESYVYGTGNQRLIRQAGTTRTLYLAGMEVAVTGTSRTINCYLTIGATQIGIKTVNGSGVTTGFSWSCGSMHNSNICQTPVYTTAVSPEVPARKRYTPYGGNRNTVTFTNTDRGFLNQPHDTTGLVYLNNRYMDPQLGHFISVDPLVGKTGMPYLYGDGNPATFSDPSGLCIGGPAGDTSLTTKEHQNLDFLCNGGGSNGKDASGNTKQLSQRIREWNKYYDDINPPVVIGVTIENITNWFGGVGDGVRGKAAGLLDSAQCMANRDCSARVAWNALRHPDETIKGLLNWDRCSDGFDGDCAGAFMFDVFMIFALKNMAGRSNGGAGPATNTAGELPGFSSSAAQLEAKFKHAANFGVVESRGASGFEAFGKAVDSFVADSGTVRVVGTYRGNPAILNYNPATAQVVVQATDGALVSGWQMSPAQLQNVITKASLGGG